MTQRSSALFRFFQRSDDTARFRDSGAQHRFRRVLVFSAPRPRLGFVFYILYIPTQTRASLSVGLPARLFVCLFRSVCFFVFVFYSTATETRVRLLSTIFIYYSLREQIRFSVEWSPWRAWRPTTPRQELPRLRRQEQGVVSRIQEQAERLPVSLQQGRIRIVSRQGPATIIYSGQHRHRDA